jgi:hypothetical protein
MRLVRLTASGALTLSLLGAPLAVEAQQAAKAQRVGFCTCSYHTRAWKLSPSQAGTKDRLL